MIYKNLIYLPIYLKLSKFVVVSLFQTKWNLELCDKINASSFCRRRLPVIMVRSKMAENLRSATQLVEQGHVRVGTDVVKDPAFMVYKNNYIDYVHTNHMEMENHGEIVVYEMSTLLF